nr:MAG TPA: hypothetical protein [Caudoviricetes sp.]
MKGISALQSMKLQKLEVKFLTPIGMVRIVETLMSPLPLLLIKLMLSVMSLGTIQTSFIDTPRNSKT